MRQKVIRFVVFLVTFYFSSASVLLAADNYSIDSSHSTAIFRIKHLGVSNFYGRFNGVSGTFSMDEKNINKSSVHVSIKVDDIDTNHGKRDAHLKGPDFFNSKAFPVITFDGKEFKDLGNGKVRVSGDLFVHGVKKNVTLDMTHVGSGSDPWGGYRSGFEGVLTIKRSDFGMNYMIGGIGDEVRITIGIEGVRK